MPDVSVIIPCYNSAPFLAEAIDSALEQAAEGFEVEVILVDDGSTDGSRAVIESYGDRIEVLFQQNQGACAARNAGLAISKAQSIFFLDADDVICPRALIALHQMLSKLQASAAVYGDAKWVSDSGKPLLKHDKTKLPEKMHAVAALIGQNLLTGRVLHRAENLRKIRGFDVSLSRGQEFDLHFRLALSGVSFVSLPQYVLLYRVHSGPERISAKGFSGNDPGYFLQLNERHQSLLDAAYGRGAWPEQVDSRMAERIWEIGRGLVREGSSEWAQVYFQNAKQLLPAYGAFGAMPYRCLCRLLGPIRTERLLIRLRALRLFSTDG